MTNWLTGPQVAQHFSVCDMTISRWLKNEELGFPQPMRIHGRRYWKRAELEEWAESRRMLPQALPFDGNSKAKDSVTT